MQSRSLAGGVPEPEELYGRDHLIRYVWEQIEANNVFLVAPRRFGKTGVMGHLLRRPQEGFLPVYLEVEDVHDPDKFATALVTALLEHDALRGLMATAKGLPGKVGEFLTQHVGSLKVSEIEVALRAVVKDNWEAVAKALILEMENAAARVLFILDEFPQFVDNLARKHGSEAARGFLAWFRSLRMKQKDQLRRFRFIIGGSTGIDMVLRRLDAPDKLMDFCRIPVEAISPEAAARLLDDQEKRYGLRLTPEARAAISALISPPVPYFLHMLLSQVRMEERLAGKELTAEDIRTVYAQRVLGPTCRSYFDYYRRRLQRYGEPGEKAAMAILQGIAGAPNGRASNSVLFDTYRKAVGKQASSFGFDEIMADLEGDWYVVLDPTTNEYYFLLGTMKDWWQRFYRTRAVRAGK